MSLPYSRGSPRSASRRPTSTNSTSVDSAAAESHGLSQFACSICVDKARDPVVTRCGHLFCWPCLYRWVNEYSRHRDCPICKSAVEIEGDAADVTPILYGPPVSGSCHRRDQEAEGGLPVPPRPGTPSSRRHLQSQQGATRVPSPSDGAANQRSDR